MVEKESQNLKYHLLLRFRTFCDVSEKTDLKIHQLRREEENQLEGGCFVIMG